MDEPVVLVLECVAQPAWSVLAARGDAERHVMERLAGWRPAEPLATLQFATLQIGPGEWLLVADEWPDRLTGPSGAPTQAPDAPDAPDARIEVLEQRIERDLRRALHEVAADVQSVSDAWGVWQLRGPLQAIRALIAQGSPVDLRDPHMRERGGFRCALGPFSVVIRPVEEGTALEIRVERSYSDALGAWLRRRVGRTAGSSGGGIDGRGVEAGT